MPNNLTPREKGVLRLVSAGYERRRAVINAEISPTRLTARERQIMILYASGYENSQIALICDDISIQTVKNHIYNIFNKLNAQNARHAVAIALKLDIIRVNEIEP